MSFPGLPFGGSGISEKKIKFLIQFKNATEASHTPLLNDICTQIFFRKPSSTIWGWRYLARLIPYYGIMDLTKYEDAKKNMKTRSGGILKICGCNQVKQDHFYQKISIKNFTTFISTL
jgi:hypothetical protein